MKPAKKILHIGSLISVIIAVIVVNEILSEDSFYEKYEGYDLSMDTEGAERKDSYTTYLLNHKDASCPTGEINIPLLSYTDGYDLEDYSEFYPERETALYGPIR